MKIHQKEQVEKDWTACKEYDKIGITINDFLKINNMGRTKELLELQFADGEWEELMSNLNTDISPSIYSAMEMYAIECCQATLNKASENAKIEKEYSIKYQDFIPDGIDKESITNLNNIILL